MPTPIWPCRKQDALAEYGQAIDFEWSLINEGATLVMEDYDSDGNYSVTTTQIPPAIG